MSIQKILIALGVLLLGGALLAACGAPATPVAPPATQPAAATEPPAAATEAPAAAQAPEAAAAPQSVALQFETCGGCHRDAGEEHQGSYNRLYQDGVIQVTGVTYKFVPAAGDKTDTTVVTFKMTKDGQPISAASVENSNIYFVAYTGKTFEGAGRLSIKGKLSFDAGSGVTTSTLVELPSTDKAFVDYTDLSQVDGVIVVYGYDKQLGSLPARIKQVAFPYAALGKTGKGTNYVSAANNDGCEKCHSDPFLKHGNIYGQVAGDPKTDFITCKACHLDNTNGGHFEWQMLVDNPEAAAEYLAAGEEAATDAIKAQYGYKTTLMNDVHMSHAMEFPYPQSMANCATCHEGKLDQILTDANFQIATCKSCHAVTGAVKKDGETVVYDTTQFALKTILPEAIHGKMDLDKTDCTSCHGVGEGKSAKPFNQIHTGYDKAIYTADGKRISDIVTVKIDKAAFADNKLTFSFSAASSEDIGLDVKTITPTVMVGLYGWDTKDYLVGPHERLIDDNKDGAIDNKDARTLEFVLDGEETNPRFTVGSAADGKWEVTADLSAWADLIKDGKVKRVEIAVMPELVNADEVVMALTAPSRTFDLATNRFNDSFYSPIVKVTDGCDTCHDALATTFHSADRSGNIVVCRMCHITKAGGSHLELQSRSIDSYVHAIHSAQQFDIGDIDFTDPVQATHYATEIEMPFPKHGITNCEACHVAGTNNVPLQSKSLPGLLSPTDVVQDRAIADVPAFVTGPATRACGGCHRAELIKEDNADGLTLFNQHTSQYGYMVEAGETPLDTLQTVFDKVMALFK